MSMVDYGALLRVDGKLVNRDGDLFMDMQEAVGFTLDKAQYFYNGKDYEIDISDNFYVYAGKPEFLLTFYKTHFYIISNGKVIKSVSTDERINEYSFYINGVNVTVSQLDKKWRNNYYEKFDDDDKERLYYLHGKKRANMIIYRQAKKSRRVSYRYKSCRYIAKWEHDGKKYEVLYGYGIEPDFDIWNGVKDRAYDFSDDEKKFIDSWFAEDEKCSDVKSVEQ